ncbi:hypothetical protein T4D_7923 [Trichinella pseudospiralis]|uniref:Uncharacterized protein n=1 Tax=Trichinella pseudospiralis TaxID=6337 RepID=A0A0V1FDK8_TRIPS|nr:hypothetical protein T4D_7923 [Trichinella pseudospiralis]
MLSPSLSLAFGRSFHTSTISLPLSSGCDYSCLKGSSVKVGFSLVCYASFPRSILNVFILKMLKKIVYSREARIEVVSHCCFFVPLRAGQTCEVKLPCALLHYVIDASCCTTSTEISCRVRLTARRNLCRPC